MANDVFTLATDVEVSLYTYDSDVFIWGVTRWDDGDKWDSGSSVESWQVITGEVASIETDNGLSIEMGLTRPEPATATIVMQGSTYDPFTNVQVKTGTPIRIRVRPQPDTAPSTWVTLFQGQLENASASYNHDFVNTLTLTATTRLKSFLNFTAQPDPEGVTPTITVPSPCYAADYFTAFNTAFGSTMITASGAPGLVGYDLDGYESFDPVALGEIVNQLLDANLGAIVYEPITDPDRHYFYTLNELENRQLEPNVIFQAEASAEPLRSSFSDITIGFDTDEIVNSVNFTTTLGFGPEIIKNDDSIALYGDLGLELETIHWNDADATEWANRIALRLPERRVQNIEAPAILRAGQLNQNLLRQPFEVASVEINNANLLISETYFITRVRHYIDPDTWTTNLDLWKGN
jgi:hypothetical protein